MNAYLEFLFYFVLLYVLIRFIQTYLFRALYRITKSEKLSFAGFALFYLPGTVVHELAHYVTALILLVDAKKFNLMPDVTDHKNGGKSVRLGSVHVAQSDPIRATLIGVAPLFVGLGLLAWLSTAIAFPHDIWWMNVFFVYAVLTLSSGMYLSHSDIKAGLFLSIALIAILGISSIFVGFDSLANWGKILLSQEWLLLVVNRLNPALQLSIIIDGILAILLILARVTLKK